MARWLSVENQFGLMLPKTREAPALFPKFATREVSELEEDPGLVHVQVQDLSGRFAQHVLLTAQQANKHNVQQLLSDIVQVPAHTIQFDASTATARVSAFNFLQRSVMQQSWQVTRKLRRDGVVNASFLGVQCPMCGDAESDRTIFWARLDSPMSDVLRYVSDIAEDDMNCECAWGVCVCSKCLIYDDNKDVVCPLCADLEAISVAHHKTWISNIVSFLSRLWELEESLGPEAKHDIAALYRGHEQVYRPTNHEVLLRNIDIYSLTISPYLQKSKRSRAFAFKI